MQTLMLQLSFITVSCSISCATLLFKCDTSVDTSSLENMLVKFTY